MKSGKFRNGAEIENIHFPPTIPSFFQEHRNQAIIPQRINNNCLTEISDVGGVVYTRGRMSTNRKTKVKGKRARPSSSGNAGGTVGGVGGGGGGRGSVASEELKAKILREVESVKPGLLTDGELAERLPVSVTKQSRMEATNALLLKGRLKLVQGTNDEGEVALMYKFVDAVMAARLSGMDANEQMVYQQIERAKGSGCTSKDLKYRTNIKAAGELKIYIGRLKERGLIKEIMSVQDGSRRKVLILEGIEAGTEHSGGPWYDEATGGYDVEFVDVIYKVVHKYICAKKGGASLEEISAYIKRTNCTKVELGLAHIGALVQTMLYDDAIEECHSANININNNNNQHIDDDRKGFEAHDAGVKYTSVRATPAVNRTADVPCGSCPVFNECSPDGVINPKSCIYMGNWLKGVLDW